MEAADREKWKGLTEEDDKWRLPTNGYGEQQEQTREKKEDEWFEGRDWDALQLSRKNGKMTDDVGSLTGEDRPPKRANAIKQVIRKGRPQLRCKERCKIGKEEDKWRLPIGRSGKG